MNIKQRYFVHKKVLIFSSFTLFLLSGCFAQKEEVVGFDKAALFELMQKLNVQHDGTPQGILQATQDAWKRTGERWETPNLHEDKKNELRPLFETLGLVQEWAPQHKHYDGAVFLGATLTAMEVKIAHFKALLEQKKLPYNTVVVLTGERDLIQKEKDALQQMGADLSVVKTEADMIRFLLEQNENRVLLKNKKLEFVDVPATYKEDGTKVRPTTGDTVVAWLKEGASPGTYLVLSLQPHCRYQQEVLKTLLPDGYTIDVVGGSDRYSNRVAVYLDAITRALYAGLQKK